MVALEVREGGNGAGARRVKSGGGGVGWKSKVVL